MIPNYSSKARDLMSRNYRDGSPETMLSIVRESFEYEVFQDLQDHLYQKFARPSVIFSFDESGTVRSRFPRKRVPRPEEFFHYLMSITAGSRYRAIIEFDEQKYVSELIEKGIEKPGVSWGWRESSLGLLDLYIPLRIGSASGGFRTSGVLAFGKYQGRQSGNLNELHRWIDSITSGDNRLSYFSGIGPKARRKKASRLHHLARQIPYITEDEQREIEKDVQSVVKLTELFLERAAKAKTLFGEEKLVGDLGLGEPPLDITMEHLWLVIGRALGRIIDRLECSTAAVFFSNYKDFTEMKRVAVMPQGGGGVFDRIILKSYTEFKHLEIKRWIDIPARDGYFEWLNPRTLLGCSSGVLFGRETIGAHLVLIAFGFGPSRRLAPSERTALYDAINSHVFRFIDAALFSIELDNLMAETGHLLGRYIGRVRTAVDSLREIAPAVPDDSSHQEEFALAMRSLLSGTTRLELVRQNFYHFSFERLGVNNASVRGQSIEMPVASHLTVTKGEVIDLIAIIDEMRLSFDVEVAQAELQQVRYTITCHSAHIKGRESSLRLVLLNLFDNAIKFSYNGTYITLHVSAEGGSCTLTLTNLGVGVPKDEWKSVFRPLFRSRVTGVKRVEGLGLGLSYVRRVIEEEFHGTVFLTSYPAAMRRPPRFEGDNWLTRLIITIPLATVTGPEE